MFKVGDKVEHVLSKDYLLILEVRNGEYVVRTKDLREVVVKDFEVVYVFLENNLQIRFIHQITPFRIRPARPFL